MDWIQTYGAVAAAVLCPLFVTSFVDLGAEPRWGDIAVAAGVEEKRWTRGRHIDCRRLVIRKVTCVG